MEHPVRQLSREILGLQVPMANMVPYVVSEGVDKEHLQIASQVLAEAFLHSAIL
jgi:outer membrane biogenesis lipoprotein LolB